MIQGFGDMKITEIKVSAGKDCFILKPESLEAVIDGKRCPEISKKIAAQVFKTVAGPAEKWFDLLKKPNL